MSMPHPITRGDFLDRILFLEIDAAQAIKALFLGGAAGVQKAQLYVLYEPY